MDKPRLVPVSAERIAALESQLALHRIAQLEAEVKTLKHIIMVDNEKDLLGIRVAAAEADRDRAREALRGLHDDVVDYQRVNNLGGYDNHWLVAARAALAGESK